MYFRKRKILILLMVLYLLTGCMKSLNTADNNTLLHILASESYMGRLTGSKGNLLAQEKLVEVFKTIGLEPFDGQGYLHQYDQMYYPLDKQKYSMEISSDNQKEYFLEYGVDFLHRNLVPNVDIEYPVVTDINEAIDKDVIVLVDGTKESISYIQKIITMENIKAALFKTDVFRKTISVNGNSKPLFQLSPAAYEKLVNLSNPIAKINVEVTGTNIKACNVIGKISGKNNNEALIISAHFDHVGQSGNTIYYGALDNASGVYAITELANKLKAYSNNSILPRDVYICAFNGEESGINGSTYFAEYMKNKYDKLIVINLDTIGLKGEKQFDIVGDEHVSGELIQSITKHLNNQNINCDIHYTNSLISDHIPFSNNYFPALTISDHNISYIHTPEDTVDIIDIDRINTLIDSLFEYIITEQNKLFENKSMFEYKEGKDNESEEVIDKEAMEKYRAFTNEQLKNVPFDKYKVVKYEDRFTEIYHITKRFESVEEVKSFYNDLVISESYNDYELYSVTITDLSCPDIDYNKVELDKLYDRELSSDTIHSLTITYINRNDKSKAFRISVNKIPLEGTDSPLKTKSVQVNEQEYTLVYDDNTDIVWSIYTVINGKLKMSLLRGDIIKKENLIIKSNLTVNNIGDIIQFIKSIDAKQITNYLN
jgi:hypothetical protein